MNYPAANVASALGLRVRDFRNKKSGTIDPKRLVVKSEFGVAIAAFCKLANLKPQVVKKGSGGVVAVFNRKTFESKKVGLTAFKAH